MIKELLKMSTSAFSTSDEVVLSRNVDRPSHGKTPEDQIEAVYEVLRCVEWINVGQYKVVALQFPDEMMCDSIPVLSHLRSRTSANIVILGDTSYGSCCVDEIAAQHYSADSIIHYGRACLSPTRRLPVLFVFGRLPLDVSDCTQQFEKLFLDKQNRVVLLYDTVYAYAVDTLANSISSRHSHVLISKLCIPGSNRTESDQYICSSTCKEPNNSLQKNDDISEDIGSDSKKLECSEIPCSQSEQMVQKCGRSFSLPNSACIEDYEMFYIGKESLTLSNLMMTFNQCKFSSYDPESKTARKENMNVNKALMKRYYMIERAKDARIVGIVVGTLGVAQYLQVIDRLKSSIKAAGKKSYTFVVGKLNVPKLANFMEVDVFVLVACPENSLLDTSEFYKPVVTPFEMEMACNTEREWTGKYVTDFRSLLPGGEDYVEISTSKEENVDVSLISGNMRILGIMDTPELSSTAVVPRNESLAVSTIPADTAGEFLSARSWRGLDQQLGETPVGKAVEGRKGIASGYTHEEANS